MKRFRLPVLLLTNDAVVLLVIHQRHVNVKALPQQLGDGVFPLQPLIPPRGFDMLPRELAFINRTSRLRRSWQARFLFRRLKAKSGFEPLAAGLVPPGAGNADANKWLATCHVSCAARSHPPGWMPRRRSASAQSHMASGMAFSLPTAECAASNRASFKLASFVSS